MKNRIIATTLLTCVALPLAVVAAEKKKTSVSFTTADADRDGKVTAAEYVAAMKGKLDEAAARAKFAELDQDKDGTLTRAEFEGGSGEKKSRSKKSGTGATDSASMPRS